MVRKAGVYCDKDCRFYDSQHGMCTYRESIFSQEIGKSELIILGNLVYMLKQKAQKV